MKREIVAIAGPTAVGKTKFSIAIAKEFCGEIVSCDSMQLYKYMNIGSAKPTAQEQAEVKHYLVDEIDPAIPFSAAEYQKRAKEAIEHIFSENKLPVIAGGTGLYLNSLLYEMDFGGAPQNTELRGTVEKEAELAAAREEAEKTAAKLGAYESARSGAAERADLREKENAELSARAKKLEEENVSAVEKLAAEAERVAELEKRSGQYEELMVRFSQVESENAALKQSEQSGEELRGELDRLNKQVEELIVKNSDQAKEIKSLKRTNSSLDKQIKEMLEDGQLTL